jgi:biopolymer transport protein ExbD
MRFNRNRSSSMLEVNLVPMLDVLMTVLTFFIIVSMTLMAEQSVEMQLPNRPDAPQNADQGGTPEPMIVQLKPQGGLVLNDQQATKEQLREQLRAYLAQNPKGFAVLQADANLTYEEVVQLLGEMKEIGGNRVSLAIE